VLQLLKSVSTLTTVCAMSGARAAADPWEVFDTLNADVVLLQECRPRTAAGGSGHLHLVPIRHGWGTAVWSRFPLTETACLPDAAQCNWASYKPALDGYVASATVHPPAGPVLSLRSLHACADTIEIDQLAAFNIDHLLPSGPRREVWPIDLAWWALRDVTSAKGALILGGDLNMARLFDTNYGSRRGHQARFDRFARSGWHEVEIPSRRSADLLQTPLGTLPA
jgi:hypothetical protein